LEEIAIDFVPRDLAESDLKAVKTALENYRRYKYSVYDRKRLDLDMEFHIQIAKLGKRPFFSNLIQGFYENFYFRLNTVLLTPYIGRFTSEHELLYSALVDRDFKTAKRIARRHQKTARKIMLDSKRR
jgi:DNA-binding GntR family transcriptional regulator